MWGIVIFPLLLRIGSGIGVVYGHKFSQTTTWPNDANYDLFYTSDWNEIDTDTEIHGNLPVYLKNSSYIHNGCGAFSMGETVSGHNFSHIFDCFGKLHGWYFEESRDGDIHVRARSSFLRGTFYNDSEAIGDIRPAIYFGVETPRFNRKERLDAIAYGSKSDNINVALWDMGLRNPVTMEKQLTAVSDVMTYLAIGKDTLSTSVFSYENFNGSGVLSSAHPKYIPNTKTTVNFALTPGEMGNASVFTIFTQNYGNTNLDVLLKIELSKDMGSARTPYMHSFSVTEHYAIFVMGPCDFHMMCVMESIETDWSGIAECYKWVSRAKESPVMVVAHSGPNKGKVIGVGSTKPLFSFHHVNAYEEDDLHVVLDLIAFPNSTILSQPVFQRDIMLSQEERDASPKVEQTLNRLEITLAESLDKVESIAISDFSQVTDEGKHYFFDFPLINSGVAAKAGKHCYIYGVSAPFAGDSSSYSSAAVVKVNVCDKSEHLIAFDLSSDGQRPNGDISFVADPNAMNEDDGVLLVNFMDGRAPAGKGTYFLMVLDAKTMTERARITTPITTWMPYAFHGLWTKN